MKPSAFACAILLSGLSAGAVAVPVAVMKLPHGIALQVMESAVSCNGEPGAFLFDRNGKKTDQTCNVQITADGVRTLFAGYGKPVFWSKDQFSTIDLPTKN